MQDSAQGCGEALQGWQGSLPQRKQEQGYWRPPGLPEEHR